MLSRNRNKKSTKRFFKKLLCNSHTVDYVSGYTIFNIGGNNYRLITAVHYNSQLCYIYLGISKRIFGKLKIELMFFANTERFC